MAAAASNSNYVAPKLISVECDGANLYRGFLKGRTLYSLQRDNVPLTIKLANGSTVVAYMQDNGRAMRYEGSYQANAANGWKGKDIYTQTVSFTVRQVRDQLPDIGHFVCLSTTDTQEGTPMGGHGAHTVTHLALCGDEKIVDIEIGEKSKSSK